jgi:poly(A) polymerase
MKITADWLDDPATQDVLNLLTAAGHQAYLVGGCVRNALLGAPVSDLDIATDAHPEKVAALAPKAGFKPVPTGIDHGTITLVRGEAVFEITTFRRDIETFGRHATVAFSKDIHDDACRRDFTMNALYATASGEVLDPVGQGLSDLRQRHVRFVGEAEARIREDYLRILRFFRFTAWYGAPDEGFDAEGLAASAANFAGIETLSKERIGHEIRKLLSAPNPGPAVASMAQAGVLAHVITGADPRALPPLIHLEALHAPGSADWEMRLAALGGENPAEALRLSRNEGKRLSRLRDHIGSMEGAAELGYRLGQADARAVLLLRSALLEQEIDPVSLQNAEIGAQAQFPIRAADLADRFSGPALGAALREREARWIASGFALSRAALLA